MTEKGTTTRITPLLRPVLDALKSELHAAGMKVSSKDDIACAALWAARFQPIEVVKGMMEAYYKAEGAASTRPTDLSRP